MIGARLSQPRVPRMRAGARRTGTHARFADLRSYVSGLIWLCVFTVSLFGLCPCSHAKQAPSYRNTLLVALAAKDRALDSGDPADWATTLDLLQRADALQATAVTKYEIGFAAAQLDKLDIAIENFQAAIQRGLSGKASERAREYIVSHLAQMAQVHLEGPAGTAILLRGAERARLPLSTFIYVAPGPVTLEAVFPNQQRVERHLELAAGRITRALLEPDETQPPPLQERLASLRGVNNQDSASAEPHGSGEARASFALHQTATPSAIKPSRSRRQAGWALAAAGATVAVLSGAFMPVAYSGVTSSRNALRDACEVQLGGPDTCSHAKQGRWQEAQSASNAVATWKMARTVSWVGLLTGLAATLGGGALIAQPWKGEHALATMQMSFDPYALQVSYRAPLW